MQAVHQHRKTWKPMFNACKFISTLRLAGQNNILPCLEGKRVTKYIEVSQKSILSKVMLLNTEEFIHYKKYIQYIIKKSY